MQETIHDSLNLSLIRDAGIYDSIDKDWVLLEHSFLEHLDLFNCSFNFFKYFLEILYHLFLNVLSTRRAARELSRGAVSSVLIIIPKYNKPAVMFLTVGKKEVPDLEEVSKQLGWVNHYLP